MRRNAGPLCRPGVGATAPAAVNGSLDRDAISRIAVPVDFAKLVYEQLKPGSSLLLTDQSRSWQVALPGCVYFLLSFAGLVHVRGQRWGATRWPERISRAR